VLFKLCCYAETVASSRFVNFAVLRFEVQEGGTIESNVLPIFLHIINVALPDKNIDESNDCRYSSERVERELKQLSRPRHCDRFVIENSSKGRKYSNR